MNLARTWRGSMLVVACVAMVPLVPLRGIAAATFVVSATDDTSGSTCSDTCTLRQAISAANALPGADTILFGIPGAGPHTITVGSGFPPITEAVLIDGYSQPGASPNTRTDASDDAVLKVRIASSGGIIFVCGDDTEIRGLSFGPVEIFALSVGAASCPGKGQRTRITGNFFGLAPDGSSLGQINQGIEVYYAQVQIGGELPAERNVFANARISGINLHDPLGAAGGSVVLNNLFGTDTSGTLALPNARGIFVQDSDLTLGSDVAPNLFRFNGRAIVVNYDAQGNRLYANHVSDSTGIGIDLADDGVTANDIDDPDTGANERQNFPLLDSALVSASGLSVSGSLDVPASVDGESYRVAVYESAACDASGYGEGEVYLGSQLVTLSDSSTELEKFTFTLPSPPALGQVITATATNPDGSTSEFSACVPVQNSIVFGDGFES